MKINSDVLDNLLRRSSLLSEFQKELIQEGMRHALFGDCPDALYEYLKGLRILQTSDSLDLFHQKCKENFKFFSDILKEKVVEYDWDYAGLSKNPQFFGTQKDWNQTLITRINQVSSEIHKKTLKGGGNLILCHPDMEAVFLDLDYIKEDYSEFPGYVQLGVLGSGRYTILSSPSIDPDKVIVIRMELNSDNLSDSESDGHFGVINILNLKSL